MLCYAELADESLMKQYCTDISNIVMRQPLLSLGYLHIGIMCLLVLIAVHPSYSSDSISKTSISTTILVSDLI